MMILSVRLWNWEGSSFTPFTLHNQIMVSFRCDTDSSTREGFATAYASAIFDYIPGPSAAIDYEFGFFFWNMLLASFFCDRHTSSGTTHTSVVVPASIQEIYSRR
mmetsp:Transcript_43232/g.48951  ORF Transcript_43232/g.48951 Transcript_43232/m.48951 type:complete len:105 (+) Transcript_43232:160-474(+)